MLKKLQLKFIVITMFALGSLMLVQTMTVNAISIYQKDVKMKEILQVITANNGVLPKGYDDTSREHAQDIFNPFGQFEITLETPYSTRYFVVELTGNVVTKVSTENIAAVDNRKALEYAAQIYGTEPGYGTLDSYRYLYTKNGDRSMMVFLYFQNEVKEIATLFSISVTVSAVTLLVLLAIIYLLSKNAMKPVAESINKQKQFITDAGHELKTPLTIISADAEVLEMCHGENEWTASIKNQTSRMNVLVKNLVELTKLNEAQDTSERTNFSLSDAVIETASDFESRAKINGQSLIFSVSPSIRYFGNEAEIRQLVSILCDNAIKYTDKGGTIKISLYRSGTSTYLDIFNTTEYVNPSSVSRLFDRFYRGDSSRSRETGGYGIGLSIAKAIVDRHKGKIKAIANGTKEITFRVTL
ncbi:MAG: GHKL domain-containing protein [Clostridia bacterium]|nr:GHKL domain-containing protein [Clostridia bacterium]